MNRASSEIPTTLFGKVVCITGTMHSISRDDLKAALTAAGALVAGSVNKHTALLVVGKINPGTKLDKAKELGIPIIGEEIVEMLRSGEFLTRGNTFPVYDLERHATEQVVANALAMVMLELRLDSLVIDNMTRAKIMAGHYRITVVNDAEMNGTRFTLTKEEGDDVVQ